MFKSILSVILIVASTFMGNSYSERLSGRRKCLSEVIEAISRMKAMISFSGYDIQKVVPDSFQNTALSTYFADNRDDAEDFSLWWSNAVESVDRSVGINKEDRELLHSLGKGLGLTDITGQMAHLELYSELFTQRLTSAKESEKEKGRLYRVLGFSLGCAVALVVM